MPYNKKLITLAGITGALVIIYVLSFVLSPQTRASRAARWTPLDGKTALVAAAIELEGIGRERVTLIKEGEAWFVSTEEGAEEGAQKKPARSDRVDDLLSALTREDFYPVRSRSASSWEKFGVSENPASKIVVKDAGKEKLLELDLGEVSGNEIYLRRAGEDTVRSTADIFSAFVSGGGASWRDTRLFPDHDKQQLTVESVQRLRVAPSAPEEPFSIVREKGAWQFDGSAEAVDSAAVTAAIRFILDCSGDDFIPDLAPFANQFSGSAGKIILEIGDGTAHTLTLGPKFEGKQSARVSSSPYIYGLADWTVSRLFRGKSEYVATGNGE
ncbi:MAG: DUF4340 domain-containing protein [Spirochaetaceae bacterium]|jgi:hypothetical protein|nr:DUF4340 domain-containing protein [Spirochaetaceae bacterium]